MSEISISRTARGLTRRPERLRSADPADGSARAPRRRQLLLAGLVVAVLTGAGAVATRTPIFAARHLQVGGVSELTPREVLRRAGIRPGVNVFHLDTARAERALESDPWIFGASVTRDLPSTVRVAITERIPVGVVKDAGVAAADGVRLPGADRRGLPSVETVPSGDGSPAAALGALPSGELDEIASARYTPVDGIELRLRVGTVVSYGAPVLFEEKGAALVAMLDWLEAEGNAAVRIDLRSPSAPTAILGVPSIVQGASDSSREKTVATSAQDVSPLRTTDLRAQGGSA